MKRLCQRLSVSRSGYYDWLKRTPSVHTQQDAVLLTHIKRVFKASAERYGSPKIYQALRAESIVISRKRVARLMRENGLKARVERVYKRLSKLRAELKVLPNYRLQAPKPTGPNQRCDLYPPWPSARIPGRDCRSLVAKNYWLVASREAQCGTLGCRLVSSIEAIQTKSGTNFAY